MTTPLCSFSIVTPNSRTSPSPTGLTSIACGPPARVSAWYPGDAGFPLPDLVLIVATTSPSTLSLNFPPAGWFKKNSS
jgi:hypothetical protein